MRDLAQAVVHPLAHVAPDAVLDADVTVWQFASVLRGARIGEGSSVGSCAVVDASVVGRFCAIGHGAQIHPGMVIEDQVFIGPGALLLNDRWPRTHKHGFDVEKLLRREKAVIVVCTRASIGAGAIIKPGVVIGGGAMVAAGALVERTVPPMHLVKADGEVIPIQRRQLVRMPTVER